MALSPQDYVLIIGALGGKDVLGKAAGWLFSRKKRAKVDAARARLEDQLLEVKTRIVELSGQVLDLKKQLSEGATKADIARLEGMIQSSVIETERALDSVRQEMGSLNDRVRGAEKLAGTLGDIIHTVVRDMGAMRNEWEAVKQQVARERAS